jgi:hypothetical protein
MSTLKQSRANSLLGYPADARLLIINADDFGMCHAINEGIFRSLAQGVVRSTSLMVPCIGAPEALQFLGEHPQFPFAIHLTAICDSPSNCWEPLSAVESIPTLVDAQDLFYPFDGMPAMLAHVNIDQMEVEFRAQIEALMAAGLHPSHLDWHSLRINTRVDTFELMFKLAREYGLALRVISQNLWDRLLDQGFPAVDTYFLDSSQLDPATKPSCYAQMLHELPVGLTEWAVHPGLDSAELQTIEPTGNHFRQKDYEFVTSPQAKEWIEKEGIILLDYRPLQTVWNSH